MERQWQRRLEGGARAAWQTLRERVGEVQAPTLRLGVTGLSRSGKTVFLAALVHNLIHGGRLPLFAPYAEGRLTGAALAPQPDDAVPRFPYEAHVRALTDARVWPRSTTQIAELRLTLEYESATAWGRRFGPGVLHLDLVDYPGEWLLDLALLDRPFEAWCANALSQAVGRPAAAGPWLAAVETVDPAAPEDEAVAADLADRFTTYLKAARRDPNALAALPPGRFLMPGDLAGSPALTFSPLRLAGAPAPGSLGAMMERRYNAYRAHVVRPFFRDHFARLDRQIVLVDVLAALNGGPEALDELRRSLSGVLGAFRVGRLSFLGSLVDRRIDKILFAATKADHIHQSDHDRLERILGELVAEARRTAAFAGAEVDIAAIAAVRATRERQVTRGGESLPAIVGTPLQGETVSGRTFDGATTVGLFPGDLPDDPGAVFAERGADYGVTTVRFRPPELETAEDARPLSLPHIRLDRAMQFLMGDRLA